MAGTGHIDMGDLFTVEEGAGSWGWGTSAFGAEVGIQLCGAQSEMFSFKYGSWHLAVRVSGSSLL